MRGHGPRSPTKRVTRPTTCASSPRGVSSSSLSALHHSDGSGRRRGATIAFHSLPCSERTQTAYVRFYPNCTTRRAAAPLESVAFVHGHVAHAAHTTCAAVFERITHYHRSAPGEMRTLTERHPALRARGDGGTDACGWFGGGSALGATFAPKTRRERRQHRAVIDARRGWSGSRCAAPPSAAASRLARPAERTRRDHARVRVAHSPPKFTRRRCVSCKRALTRAPTP